MAGLRRGNCFSRVCVSYIHCLHSNKLVRPRMNPLFLYVLNSIHVGLTFFGVREDGGFPIFPHGALGRFPFRRQDVAARGSSPHCCQNGFSCSGDNQFGYKGLHGYEQFGDPTQPFTVAIPPVILKGLPAFRNPAPPAGTPCIWRNRSDWLDSSC